MHKRYQIKIYRKNGELKRTLNPNLITSAIKFTNSINGGQGQLTIHLNLPFNDTSIIGNDMVNVREYDENNPSGIQIYS
ncbi:MAG: hypothetical protein LBD75_06030 [Candidatus Peribacteria bacterium]|nr:hypothetical protein [Candidatus Peribacteria bacterium]